MIAEKFKEILPQDLPLIIGDLPATRQDAIGILEFSGATSTEYFGMKSDSSIFSPIVKFAIRCSSYPRGKQWATEIKEALHRYHDDMILSVFLVADVIYLGRNADKLHEFQVTFRTQVKE